MSKKTALVLALLYAVGIVGIAWGLLTIEPATMDRPDMIGLFLIGAFFGSALRHVPEILRALAGHDAPQAG